MKVDGGWWLKFEMLVLMNIVILNALESFVEVFVELAAIRRNSFVGAIA